LLPRSTGDRRDDEATQVSDMSIRSLLDRAGVGRAADDLDTSVSYGSRRHGGLDDDRHRVFLSHARELLLAASR
jgi:hypothetical protein